MRTFNYSQKIQNLLTPEIVQLLTCIHEHKGRQDLFLEANTDELKTLVDVAMIQSTGASIVALNYPLAPILFGWVV